MWDELTALPQTTLKANYGENHFFKKNYYITLRSDSWVVYSAVTNIIFSMQVMWYYHEEWYSSPQIFGCFIRWMIMKSTVCILYCKEVWNCYYDDIWTNHTNTLCSWYLVSLTLWIMQCCNFSLYISCF